MSLGMWVLVAVLGLLALLVIVWVIGAVRIKAKDEGAATKPVQPRLTNEEIARKLSRMVQVETISRHGQGVEPKFETMRNVLDELFPALTEQCEKEILCGNGQLLRWPGKDSSKKPYMFMSHIDVVPVDGEWERDPFSGDIEDGKVFGRGTFDTKGSLSVILSALNHLAEQGFVPGRDIYVLSTASEEVSGPDAPAACQYFKDRGIRLELVMDEGGGLLQGLVPGFSGEIAGIGISEKSQANPVFVAKVNGGHASTPPRQTALGKLGAFMVDVEKNQPFDYRMTPEFKEMLMSVAPYMSFPFRLVLGNLWCFGPLLTAILKRSPDVRTLMGTTCSFTMIEGSDAFNVLPNEARVTANMRVSHHQGVKGSLDAIEKVAKKHGLEMHLMEKNPGFEVKAISSTKTEGYQSLKKAINEVYPEAKVTPYIMMANTDCRYFHEVCDTALRFMPIRITNDERKHIHTVNEYAKTDTYATGAEVFMRLVEES